MSGNAWITIAVTAVVLYVLIREMVPPDVVFLGAVVVLALVGVIGPGEAFGGFANSGVLLVGTLFVVAAGLRETGVLDYFGHRFLGNVRSEQTALLCIAAVAIFKSFFLNNTSVVAILIPVILDWCRKNQVSPSKLLMPLSFLTILGGTCTLVGTSTNVVLNGLMVKANIEGMTYFEIGYAGLPCAVIGTIYMFTIGRRLLPERKEMLEQLGETRREYLVEMLVKPGCILVGKPVESAGLRQLPGLFLIEIERRGVLIGPVGPEEVIHAEDRLVFTGVVGTIVDLERIQGLVPAADATYEVAPEKRRGRRLCEVVISPSSPLVGLDVRNANFRTLYSAAVVAVHRHGARLTNKVGDIVLRPGDTLLLQTGPNFTKLQRNNPDFYLVSDVEGSRPLRFDRAWVAIAACVGMVVLMIANIDPLLAALAAAGVMVATRCISVADARQAVDWPVLVMIGASLGLGAALEKSGAAQAWPARWSTLRGPGVRSPLWRPSTSQRWCSTN